VPAVCLQGSEVQLGAWGHLAHHLPLYSTHCSRLACSLPSHDHAIISCMCVGSKSFRHHKLLAPLPPRLPPWFPCFASSLAPKLILSDAERQRLDDSPDAAFYSTPRMMQHADDDFIEALTSKRTLLLGMGACACTGTRVAGRFCGAGQRLRCMSVKLTQTEHNNVKVALCSTKAIAWLGNTYTGSQAKIPGGACTVYECCVTCGP
jgi:hypothetical protein